MRSAILVAFLGWLAFAPGAHGGMVVLDTDRYEVQAALARGWTVRWGPDLAADQAAPFADAVKRAQDCARTSPPGQCAGPMDRFLGPGGVMGAAAEIARAVPGTGDRAVAGMILQAFQQRRAVRQGRLEVEAGLATYRFWRDVKAQIPEAYVATCRTGYVTHSCIKTRMRTVTRRVDHPGKLQPYIRYRTGN